MAPAAGSTPLDVVVQGGTVIDGTAGPARMLDVGIVDGRIAAVEEHLSSAEAARTVDATGLVVAPGFIDVHTHFDAQVFWDAACTPSSLYGVTTVFTGNCGFSIAPLHGDPDYLLRLLGRVEGIPLPALVAGVPWSWSSFEEYLTAVERRGTSVNFGALAGHSAIRRAVLGGRSGEPELRKGELEAMCMLLTESLRAGAIGFSSSWAGTHLDGNGDPVPSRASSRDELLALCTVLRDFPGTQVEFIPTNGPYDDEHLELMTEMALAARAPLNWNILIPRDEAFTQGRLRSSDHAAERGAHVVGLSYPDVIRARTSFLSSGFDSLPNWAATMALAPADKLDALQDPDRRARLREGALSAQASGMPSARFEDFVVGETFDPANDGYVGKSIGTIAATQGRDAFDVLCDIVVADGLRTGLVPPPGAADDEAWRVRVKTWSDPRVVIGASDAGAHLDMLTTFDYPARFLALARHHPELSLEQAVHQLTGVPARLYGLHDRGRIAPGFCADVVMFDAASIDAGPVEWRNDLPSAAGRLYSEPEGMARVLVNGTEIVVDGRLTGARPGRVLRSGIDTRPWSGS